MYCVLTARDIVTTVYILPIDEEYIKKLREEWTREQGTDSSFITLELVYAVLRDPKSLELLKQPCPQSNYETIGSWIWNFVEEDVWNSHSEEVDVDGYDTEVDIEFSEKEKDAKLRDRLDDWVYKKQNEVPENQLSFFDT